MKTKEQILLETIENATLEEIIELSEVITYFTKTHQICWLFAENILSLQS